MNDLADLARTLQPLGSPSHSLTMNKSLILSALLTLPVGAAFLSTPATAGDCTGEPTTAAPVAAQSIVDIALGDPQFSTLVSALSAADLVTTLQGPGPFTVFAPTNDAFAKLPEGTLRDLLKPESKGALTSILTYHVVGGALDAGVVTTTNGAVSLQGQQIDFQVRTEGTGRDKVTRVLVDGAEVVLADVQASNGVIHVIDQVILPASADVVETAASAGIFDTLLTAARAAGIVDLLKADGPITVLAPTDDAFAALPAGTVETLLKPENQQQLIDILKLHVIEGRYYANQVAGVESVQPLGRQALEVRKTKDAINIGGANVVTADLDASNGVVHVIDAVIL